jgi:hypothetical protein
VTTIERRLTAMSQAHQMAGCANPAEDKLVRTVKAGIRRVKGVAQVGKDPLSPELLRQMLPPASGDLRATATAPCCCSASPGLFGAPRWCSCGLRICA